MQLDVNSLFLAFAVIAFSTAAAVTGLKLTGRSTRVVRIWIRGYILMALGAVALALIQQIEIARAASQAVILAGAFHIPVAFAHLRGVTTRHRHFVIATLAYLVVMLAFAVLPIPVAYQLPVISTVYFYMSAASIRVLLARQPHRAGSQTGARTLAGFLIVFMMILLWNGVSGYFLPDRTIAESAAQQLTMLGSIMIAAVLTIGFHWLIHVEIEAHLAELNRQLSDKNSRLELFARAISHDLRSPLLGIMGHIELAELGQVNGTGPQDNLRRAYQSATQMQTILEGLLQWSQVDAADVADDIADPNECLKAAFASLDATIRESNARVEIADELPVVKCPRSLLSQVFQNLIGNSIKYASPGADPIIRVSAAKRGDTCQFQISDNGHGIPADELDSVFEMFQRGSNVGTSSGTGIGLAFCKTVVEKCGGRIWCDSRVGEGTSVHFTLSPAQQRVEKRAAVTAPAQREQLSTT